MTSKSTSRLSIPDCQHLCKELAFFHRPPGCCLSHPIFDLQVSQNFAQKDDLLLNFAKLMYKVRPGKLCWLFLVFSNSHFDICFASQWYSVQSLFPREWQFWKLRWLQSNLIWWRGLNFLGRLQPAVKTIIYSMLFRLDLCILGRYSGTMLRTFFGRLLNEDKDTRWRECLCWIYRETFEKVFLLPIPWCVWEKPWMVLNQSHIIPR